MRAKRADSQKRENLKSEKKTTDVCPFNVVFAAVNSSLCTRVHRRAFKGKVPSHFVSKLSDDDLRIRPVGCVFSHRRCVALAVLSFLSATARRVTLGTREARALLRRAGRAVQRAALSHPAPLRFRKLHGCADSGPRPRRSFAARRLGSWRVGFADKMLSSRAVRVPVDAVPSAPGTRKLSAKSVTGVLSGRPSSCGSDDESLADEDWVGEPECWRSRRDELDDEYEHNVSSPTTARRLALARAMAVAAAAADARAVATLRAAKQARACAARRAFCRITGTDETGASTRRGRLAFGKTAKGNETGVGELSDKSRRAKTYQPREREVVGFVHGTAVRRGEGYASLALDGWYSGDAGMCSKDDGCDGDSNHRPPSKPSNNVDDALADATRKLWGGLYTTREKAVRTRTSAWGENDPHATSYQYPSQLAQTTQTTLQSGWQATRTALESASQKAHASQVRAANADAKRGISGWDVSEDDFEASEASDGENDGLLIRKTAPSPKHNTETMHSNAGVGGTLTNAVRDWRETRAVVRASDE